MKILFVVPYVPNLVRVRPYNLIRSLALRGHTVTLATLVAHPAETQDVERLRALGIQVISFPLPRWRSLLNCLLTLPTRTPLQAVYCWQPDLAREVIEQITSGNFDLVHVEHLRGARFGLAALRAGRLPVIWDSVDSITHLFRQAGKQARKLSSKLMTRFELDRTAHYEGRLAQRFARVLVTSFIDRDAFLELAPGAADRLVILPNGVDLDHFHPGEANQREPASIVISGKMSYHANEAMVLHFMQRILPFILKKRADVKVYIVGKDPSPALLALAANPAVIVTGEVPDLSAYLRRASVAVAPIPYGAGIQNKVLEAMACGTPVVASPKAVSALQALWNEEIFVEEEPEPFANRVLALLEDADLAARVGTAGRRFVERCHSWDAVALTLETVYQQAVAEHSGAGVSSSGNGDAARSN